jgi:hypothetical protein
MTTEPAQAIRVRGLEKSYPKLPVLRGILVVAYALAMFTYQRKIS